jgi:hypothetical protein
VSGRDELVVPVRSDDGDLRSDEPVFPLKTCAFGGAASPPSPSSRVPAEAAEEARAGALPKKPEPEPFQRTFVRAFVELPAGDSESPARAAIGRRRPGCDPDPTIRE